ncbi:hypothetical protein BP6252_01072 [Coleophoma cylindrospora]|uniref:Uncharacterized protein n=1 Tax=Coleophoma cylindrospora TaxID=1849047 RepID=A0A3D8SRT9_9HELO|nr:hypothetical protein BP6252_01072 [Coleophoma cylindrospora]
MGGLVAPGNTRPRSRAAMAKHVTELQADGGASSGPETASTDRQRAPSESWARQLGRGLDRAGGGLRARFCACVLAHVLALAPHHHCAA